jgi:hypothetical protein
MTELLHHPIWRTVATASRKSPRRIVLTMTLSHSNSLGAGIQGSRFERTPRAVSKYPPDL